MYFSSGGYTGDGNNPHHITVGFQPCAVLVKRRDGTGGPYFSIKVGSTVATKPVGLNAVDTTLFDFDATGFSIKSTIIALNQSTSLYSYWAWGADTADCATFSYSGDNTDNKDRTDASCVFTPNLAFVFPDSAARGPYWSSNQHSADQSQPFSTQTPAADFIQAFISGGLTVGTSLNATGVTYYALVLKAGTHLALTNYNGNGSDNRDIAHGMAAAPSGVFIQYRTATNQDLAARSGVQSGDASHDILSSSESTDMIQAVDATNVQVGTSNLVNRGTGTPNYVMVTFTDNVPPASPGAAHGQLLLTGVG